MASYSEDNSLKLDKKKITNLVKNSLLLIIVKIKERKTQ